MTFLGFLLVCFIGSVVFPFILSIATVASMMIFAPFIGENQSKASKTFLMLGMGISAFLVQVATWGVWAYFIVSTTINYLKKPAVTAHWLYWLGAFVMLFAPINWLAQKQAQQPGETEMDKRSTLLGTRMYKVVLVIWFAIFVVSAALKSSVEDGTEKAWIVLHFKNESDGPIKMGFINKRIANLAECNEFLPEMEKDLIESAKSNDPTGKISTAEFIKSECFWSKQDPLKDNIKQATHASKAGKS